MRILLAADQYPEFHNGAGAATQRLAAGLAGRGHQVTVTYPSDDGPARDDVRYAIRDHRIASLRLPHGQGVRVCRPAVASAEIDRLFAGLSEGGQIMMPLAAYPFSRKFAWLADRFGVSWQLSLPLQFESAVN